MAPSTDHRRDVALGYLRFENVAGNWVDSVIALLGADLSSDDGRIARPIMVSISNGDIEAGANLLVRGFLDGPEDWLFWSDCDAGYGPTVLAELLAAADPVERPVVGALAFSAKQVARDGMGGFLCESRPVLLDWTEVDGVRTFATRTSYPENTLVRVAATGMHTIVMHRSALEAVQGEYGNHWFDRITMADGETRLGPDVSFCVRLGAVGVPVFVHTGIHTNHQKATWLSPHTHPPEHV